MLPGRLKPRKVFLISKRKLIFTVLIIILMLVLLIYPFTHVESTDNKFPIIMYHNISKIPSMLGTYVTSVDQLEKDFIYIKENGYTSIVMDDLIKYAYNNVPLPKKPIMITFDDGHECCLNYVLPLLEKYDMKAVVSVIGCFSDFSTENPCSITEYSYLNWDEIKKLSESDRIEIQNHTYSLHSNTNRLGCKIKKGESIEAYRKVLCDDVSSLQEKLFEITGKRPTTFTYPFGYLCKESVDILKDLGFLAALTCTENQISIENINLFRLGRFNRPHGISSDNFFKRVLAH